MIKTLGGPALAITLSGVSAVASAIAPIIGVIGAVLGCIAAVYAIRAHKMKVEHMKRKQVIAKKISKDLED